MPSEEGNENIDNLFNKILKEEYKQEWKLIVIPKKFIAFLCYTLPALLMLSSGDYHNQNVLVILFFSSIVGTGFYSYLRHHTSLKAFFSNEKPLNKVIEEVKAQRSNTDFTNKLTVEEESDWSLIVSNLEKSMETSEAESAETMNLSTLFDRAEPVKDQVKKPSWFSKIFGRK